MASPVEIHLGGNGFITRKYSSSSHGALITTSNGLGNWTRQEAVCSVFFKAQQPGNFDLAIKYNVVGGSSRVSICYAEQRYELDLNGEEFHEEPVGTFQVKKPGYVRIDIQGIHKTGQWFGDISSLILKNHSLGELKYASDSNEFGWALRGPGIDVNYRNYPSKTEYFYNELTVPPGYDATGAYFMAIGFNGGYFGIQTNSETRRSILFSIWSKYDTNDPEAIPNEYAVQTVKIGDKVVDESFGGEGSGRHSNFDYWWNSGITYKFLVRGAPHGTERDGQGTKFSAWFRAPDLEWHHIATYLQPKSSHYNHGFYSFSEGLAQAGHVERKVYLGNQWARDTSGTWHEVNEMHFDSADKYRVDRICGIENGDFFLRNCGFFNKVIPDNQVFVRPQRHLPPVIDFDQLKKDFEQ